jgi:hypothetical protein
VIFFLFLYIFTIFLAKIRDSGDVDGAIALHRRISLLEPDMVANLHALGNLLLVEKGDRIESEMLFRRALVLAPAFPELHHSLSAVFCTIPTKQAARKCLDILDHAVHMIAILFIIIRS